MVDFDTLRARFFRESFSADEAMKIGFGFIMNALKEMGYPVNEDPNFKGTVERAARGFAEMVLPKKTIDEEVEKHLSATFPTPSDSMVLIPSIPAAGVCPHHLLPVLYSVTVAYLPGLIEEKNGKKSFRILGLSKIPRIVGIVAKQPLCQETFGEELAEIFFTKLNSVGAAVYLRGRHTCMECRGVEQANIYTVTSALRGPFYDSEKLRAEFMAAVNAETLKKW